MDSAVNETISQQRQHDHRMQALPKPLRHLPTHTSFAEFTSAILPAHPRDVPSIYHEPRYRIYDPTKVLVRDVVLSITPTPGVYAKLAELSSSSSVSRQPACFLHRPFNLDRRAVPFGTIIQASHKRFDEVLTVGWNTALAERLELELSTAVCIQGYKGDPERRVGLVAKFSHGSSRTLGEVYGFIVREFGEGLIIPTSDAGPDLESRIDGVAIMNAFGPDEIARALECASQLGIVAEDSHTGLLYLTGEPKELGVAVLKEKYNGMFAVCVGHRPAEEWGIQYLGTRIKQQWPEVEVHLVLEDEEPPPVKDKKLKKKAETHQPEVKQQDA